MKNRFSRKLSRPAIAQSNTTILDPPLVGIEIFTAGALKFAEAYTGTEITVTFPAAADGGAYPYTFHALIRQVLDTGTTLADGAMLGYRE